MIFIKNTGGFGFFIWQIIPSVFVFILIPIIVILIKKRFHKIPRILIILLDFAYILIGLSLFVIYANNILLEMG